MMPVPDSAAAPARATSTSPMDCQLSSDVRVASHFSRPLHNAMATSTPADVALAVVLLQLAEAWPDAAEALTIVASAAPVSRAWCAAASDARVWCALVQRLWPYAAVAEEGEPIGGWRAHARRRTLAARRVAAVRYTCNVDISDHTPCLDMHDAETGALVTSAALTVHEDVLLEHTKTAFEANHRVLLCSARLSLPAGTVWPRSVRMRVLALRARDGAVAQMFADTVQRTDTFEPDSSEDEDDSDDDDEEEEDDEEEDGGGGSADEDPDGMLGEEEPTARAAASPLQYACYHIGIGFAADDGMDAFGKLTVTARGRYARVELRLLAFHPVFFHMNGLTKQGFKHFLDGLTWVTPSARMTLRRVAVPPTAQHAGGCSATLAALVTPDVLRAIISYLAWNERAAMALTCSAFAAAVHSPDVAWRDVLLLHTAPALATPADDIMSGLFGWRDLAASIAEARLRLQQQKELLERGNTRFQRRWDRWEACAECADRAKLWRMESCALCEAANESEVAVDEPGPLSGFTFFVEMYAPTDAMVLQEELLVFNGACILPRVSASGVIGTGLHEATLYNSLSDGSGLFRAPELPDSALGQIHLYPPRTVCDPARDAAEEWVKRVHMKLWVQRRSDGAVAHLGVGAHKASADSFLSPETTLKFDVYDLFYPLEQLRVSWTAATSGDSRRTISDPCYITADVKLTWRLATGGEPRALAQLFPAALLSFDAYRGEDAGGYTLLEEQMAAMLTALDWAL